MIVKLDRDRLERVLNHRGSAWIMWAAVLPLLLVVLLLGRITYEVGRQTAPVITKMLTPPATRRAERLDFAAAVPTAAASSFAGDFAVDLKERFPLPAVADDLPAPETPTVKVEAPQVSINESAFATEAFAFDSEAFADPGAALLGAADAAVGGNEPQADGGALRRAGKERQTADGRTGRTLSMVGAMVAGDKSGAAGGEPGLGEAVQLAARPAGGGSGAGLDRPAGREKTNLAGWILQNQTALRPAVQEALGYSAEKADRTAAGSAVDAGGRLYQFFFLHRTENNLLRILVVCEGRAWRIDLPDFYLEANHVKAGHAARGRTANGGTAPIIEVALESVDAIPAEVPQVFDLVLQWLDIKGKE